MSQVPILSILIPTYDYPIGLERILIALSQSPALIEVLVFDDSPSMDLKVLIDKFSPLIPDICYKHNLSVYGHSLGPGRNWNSLLDAARGVYVVLMHHDEFPVDLKCIPSLFPILGAENAPDIVMLDLLLLDESLRPLPRHVPGILRWLITQYAPGYLFRRNVIGPTATLVVRRSIAPRFDPELRWLIDVDFYIKLCRSGFIWMNAPLIQVASVQRKKGTITNELSAELSAIDSAERRSLVKIYPKDGTWLGISVKAPFRFLELFFWIILRGLLIAEHIISKLVRAIV